jgi:RHS repeat-associated protein
LGNIRLSYTLDPYTNDLKILEENHYYPFGLKHTNYSTGKKTILKETEEDPKKVGPSADDLYKYKYNGKEWQDELGLNVYDYGGRIYDPAAPRFWQMDPMAEHRDWLSPYNYVQNNPVIRIDPDGMLDDIVINGQNGSSLTITTSLVDIEVNAGSLVGDLGGNYTLEGDDILVAALDIAGIFDPTGVADVAAASIEFNNGNFWSGLASAAGVVPLIGDLGKAGKIPKHIKTINNAIDAVKSADKAKDGTKAATKAVNPKKAAREAAAEKRAKQPASEKYAKDKAKKLEKTKGKDARREAHDKKEKGAGDRTKKQIDEDYD